MPKTKISEYSATNSANTDIEGINIDEGCPPSSINNAIRELMVHLKEFQTGASGDAFTFAGGTLMTGTNTISGAAVISGNINSSGTTNTFSGGNILSGTNTISGSAIISGNINSSGTTNTFSGGNILSGTNTFSGTNIFSSDVTLNAQRDLRFADSDSSNWVAFQAPATVASNVTWTLPAADGTSNQVLATNGSGTLSWATAGGGASISAGDSKVEVTDTGSNGTIVFNTDNAERMRVDSSGNLGIGTNSPSSYGGKLAIYKTPGTAYTDSSIAMTDGSNVTLYIGNTSTTASSIWTSDLLSFGTGADAFTERARITSGGYFKASSDGTYDGISGTYHEFNGAATSDPTLFVYNKNASYAGKVVDAYCIRNTTNASYYFFRGRVAGVADRFLVADSGNVTNTNGTYGTISDQKLKQDIVDASSQWNDIKNLRFRKYRLKADVELNPDAKPFLGLIAQEAEIVSPGLVEEQTDRDEEGNDLGTTTKSVKTSILYMKAVKALQEAMERIETLEAQNAAFEARLAALEAN